MEEFEEALLAAGERLGEAMRGGTPEEREILRAMYEKLAQWGDDQGGEGIDRSAFFAAGILAHDRIHGAALLEAAAAYLDADHRLCRSHQESQAG